MSTANAYNFIFDRSGLAWFVVGLVLAGGLLFFAGLLIGVNWGLPQGGDSLTAASTTSPVRPRSERLFVDRAQREVPRPSTPPVIDVAVTDPAPEPAPEPEETDPAPPAPAPVTTPPPSEPEPAPAPAPRERGGWEVQAGAFGVSEHADRRLADLARIGFDAYKTELVGSRGQTLTAVRLGPFASRAEAEDVAAEIGRRGGIVSFVRAR